MVSGIKRGATRKPVRKERQPWAWAQVIQHSVFVLALLSLVAGGVYLQQEDTLPIAHVTVEGEFIHVDKDALVAAVSPYVRGSFLSADVAGMREAGEALPWVKKIQVRRVWPDSLHLIVEEQIAIARWGKTGLVNADGETFYPSEETITSNLTLLRGPENSHELMTSRYQNMNKVLAEVDLKIDSLIVDERRAWSMTLSNGLKIALGRAASEQRFKRFMTVYQSGLKKYQAQIEKMDMRYTNGLSVHWKQGQKPDFNGTV
ncbi:MAG: cell division protein FtsQ/DivIB [Gammaproteobacteria bacterium]|nr:cell division protein FtsQ/DivIB [Gammaproteobacteria bacterium]MDH5592485.1 cell division protein FtsQ/DivIB [Gammaproteobacteria bacterium]